MTIRPLRFSSCFALLFLLLSSPDKATAQAAGTPSPQRSPLRVVSAGPNGEVASVEDANEIRVVFSESMTAVATAPRARPAFFHITPAVAGTYRWSGTTLLIFTPARRLPLATKYDVTVDAGTTAVSGRKLAAA